MIAASVYFRIAFLLQMDLIKLAERPDQFLQYSCAKLFWKRLEVLPDDIAQEAAHFRSGSKSEKLDLSKCLPDYC
jgi:hypothetical protein